MTFARLSSVSLLPTNLLPTSNLNLTNTDSSGFLHRLRASKPPLSAVCLFSRRRNPSRDDPLKSLGLSTVFLALGLGFASSLSSPPIVLARETSTSTSTVVQRDGDESHGGIRDSSGKEKEQVEKREEDDKELEEAYEKWKSKSYALTVPLTIVALRGSVPPPWIKGFMQSQGKRLKLQLKLREGLQGIFSDLSTTFKKGDVKVTSTAAADIVTVGDSWLGLAIKEGLIEPIQGAEEQDWFRGLSDKWKVYLRRNCEGIPDAEGKIWAAPYRWGSMVIAYKKSKFEKLKMAPIEDWDDLWRPELAGRISMVDCPREVVGAVLKYMGASYNTDNIDSKVVGGKNAVRQNLTALEKQVRLFDSTHYLKAFGVEDVWVAVGWSSDVLPAAKKIRNVAVVVPKSGASLWADLWAVPAASKFNTNQIGGRIRGPSPLIHQWIEFCLQSARGLPFRQGVLPGAIPAALEGPVVEVPKELEKVNKPKLETNLVAGVPPPHILNRCEFLEPLSDTTISDYQWLVANMQRTSPGFIERLQRKLSMVRRILQLKIHPKMT